MQCLLVEGALLAQGSLTRAPRVPESGTGCFAWLMGTPTGSCCCPIAVECGLFPIVLPSHPSRVCLCGGMDVAGLSQAL